MCDTTTIGVIVMVYPAILQENFRNIAEQENDTTLSYLTSA